MTPLKKPAFSLLLLALSIFFFIEPGHSQLPERRTVPENLRMLVYTHTNGFRHASIESGVAALSDLAQEEGILMDHTEDSLVFHDKALSAYQLVVFLNTTGDVLGPDQEKAFREFVENGGAFMGIHAATDTEYNWPWYGRLVGAYFESHPRQQEAQLQVVDRSHPSTAHMEPIWRHYDEWYNFKNIHPDIRVLIRLDETSYQGGTNGENHPIAWYHENAGGRVFYTGLGHDAATFENPVFRQHLQGGLRYCLGLE